MKLITKWFSMFVLLLLAGVTSVNAQEEGEKVYATFENPTGITWDAENKTFSWESPYGNQLHNIGLPTGNLTAYEKLVIDCEIIEGDGYRFMFYATTKGTTAGGLTIITSSGKNEYKLSDFDMDADYLTQCSEICLSGYNGSGKVKVNEVYLVKSADPLAGLKELLTTAITLGKMQNSFGKTEESFAALTQAISDGEAALADAEATSESLETAKGKIEAAIAGLTFKNGYFALKADMFKHYESLDAPGEGSSVGCAFDLGKASDLPFGDGNVSELNWADLTSYDKLYIITSGETKPRLCMNRLVAGGQQAATQEDSKMLDINPNNEFTWSTEAYQTIEGNIYVIDLKKIVEDYTFARLHCIKKQGWGAGVIVSEIILYKDNGPEPTVVTFDFNASNHAVSANGDNSGDITENEVNTVDDVVMTITPSGVSNPNRYWGTNNGPQLRMYGGTMTIEAPEGKAIKAAVFNNGKWNAGNTINGEVSTKDWEGNSTNLVLVVAANTQINSVVLTLTDKDEETTTYGPKSIANDPETAYTIAKAIELIDAGEALSDIVYVKGIVSQVDGIKDGAITYWISDDGTTTNQFECYHGKGIDGADFAAEEDIEVGATVVVSGTMKKYVPKEGDPIYEFNSGNKLYSYEAPAAAPWVTPGYYLLYNVGAGQCLTKGNGWGTQASITEVEGNGLAVQLVAVDNNFQIVTGVNNAAYGLEHLDGGTVYTDQSRGKQSTWNFIKLEGEEGSEICNIVSVDNHGGGAGAYLSANADNTIVGPAADGTSPYAQWMLISVDDHSAVLAAMAEASALKPVDATSLIVDANFSYPTIKKDAWKMEASNQNLCGGLATNPCGESWKAAFTLSQTLTDIPNGLYVLTAQAALTEYNVTGEDLPVVYANDVTSTFPSMANGEDSMNKMSEQFTAGNYYVEPLYVEVTDGTLTVGVKGTRTDTWCIWDNFELTYYGENPSMEEVAYSEALANITDGESYRIFAEVNGQKYYLAPNGYLVDNTKKAGTFTFKKVKGTAYEYGFLIDAGSSRFSNPPGTNKDALECGYISTSTAQRADWDAQVFFMNQEGKFAVRCTNSAGAESGWGYVAKAYWTIDIPNAEAPVAQYRFEPNYIWQIEEFEDARIDAFAKVQEWPIKLQNSEGLVTETSQFSANSIAAESLGLAGLTDGDWNTYFHSQWGASGVTEAHYLQAELPDAADKFYFYFVKRDPVNNGNVNNRPTKIQISGSNDGTSFTEITTISEGLPTTIPPVYYMSGLVSAEQSYKYIRFTVLDTNNHAKDDNGNCFFTFSEFYILPGDGVTNDAAKYVVPGYTDLDFEDVEAINTLDKQISKSFVDIPFNVVFNGEIVKSEIVSQPVGKAPVIPADIAIDGLLEISDPDVEIIELTTEAVNVAATWAGPFEFSSDLENAKWYNMDIRSGWYVSKCENEPYTMKSNPTELERISPEYQWAFGGSPYEVVLFNRATGASMSLSPADVGDRHCAVIRDGQYGWEIFKNNDGFVLRETGTENNWINQSGGASATNPLAFWVSTNGRTDNGSTFRVSEAPDAVEIYLAMLQAAIEDAEEAAEVPVGGLFQKQNAEDVEAYKRAIFQAGQVAVIPEPTEELLTTAIANLAAATEIFNAAPIVLPEAGAKYSFQMQYTEEGTFFMNFEDGVKIAEAATALTFVAGENVGEFYLKAANDDLYLGIAGNNNWDMTTDPEKKATWTFTALADGSYLINRVGKAGLVAATAVRSGEHVTPAAGDAIYCDKTLENGYVNWVIEPYVAPAVAFTVTPTIEGGSQAEFAIVETGTALKLAVTTENLEANGYDPKDITLKVDMLFAGRFSDKGFAMGTNENPPYMKAGIVLPLADEVTLAEDIFGTEYPFIQSIRITGLSLMKGDEPIAAIDEMIVIGFIEVYENGAPVGIKAITTDGEKADIYDLSGRKVEKVQRGGIYIINGKKVSIK